MTSKCFSYFIKAQKLVISFVTSHVLQDLQILTAAIDQKTRSKSLL